jgi:predicted lipoprotein with Yx(FWY)xxD motif
LISSVRQEGGASGVLPSLFRGRSTEESIVGIRLTYRGLLLLLMLLVVGVVAANGAPRTVTVKLRLNSAFGVNTLVDSDGLPLYHDLREKKGKIHCVGPCAEDWLPLLVNGRTKLVAGPGVKASELGTIKRPDGHLQVTYNGLALYRFSGDTIAGQMNGQGAHGVWFAVTAAGVVTTAGTAGPGATNDGGAAPGYGY